ncbi:MAG: DNA methylase [Oscillospiraceae bacterium]|nr:DNA methylase [Oscillospiraceae bacterium]
MRTTEDRTYIAIDLKSFYASVECRERGLDPLDALLVVADPTRTDKTICLAVSPSLKAYGIPGRARLFEVVQRVSEVNAARLARAPGRAFSGRSQSAEALARDPSLELDYIVAPPRMAYYMEYSTRIYQIYLKYAAPEDIHVYSIDEIFLDATDYIRTRGVDARSFAMTIVRDVLDTTGITATVGIGTNLYLAKIAMDIEAKRMKPDRDGVRIAELNERSYRERLWDHRPLTDFWRVGRGIAKKLEDRGMYTMGDVAHCSLGGDGDSHNEELLYRLFGVNAELLIDHAWGVESCLISDIKAYRPASHSISSGQVLMTPYDFQKARLIVREMTEQMVLELVDKALVTDLVELYINYDRVSLADEGLAREYAAHAERDYYGRRAPKSTHGSVRLPRYSSSTKQITEAMLALYDRIVDPALSIRRITIAACEIEDESFSGRESEGQLDLFGEMEGAAEESEEERASLEDEKRRQRVMLDIKKKYGKNAILKGTNLEKGATAMDRNRQIGGHKA